ncbi:hypothetical protein J2752_002869 [Halarchaeum rubridurum]|uniref:Secreted glycoprotein n=1 Tax=Halarchaeum rubridurum TaxID=489911 RepID=A0A830G4Q4_9EURY|nr:hypothetical protein [Halarchaeum rubridurum]MBP1955938.1 hypothetical protein [Halarchaeum rubridurum]GGM75759.1 hypothetical protein GCM10009017_27140 [Halarchaeum rubridurum]
MTDTSPSIDRRSALQAFGSLTLAALAGCTSTQTSEPSSSSTTTPVGPFASLNVQGTTLGVELESDADVEHVNLVKPNGSLFGTRDVAQGTSRVSFDLGTTYTPGDYELVAVNDDQTIGTTTRSLRPDLQILDMGIGRNQPDKMWNGASGEIADEAFITVQNQGSGPIAVTKLLFIGDVPLPSTKRGTNYVNNSDVSGIYDLETDSTTPKVVVPPGERRTVYSSTSPFGFAPGGAVTCAEHEQSGSFEIIRLC